MWHALTRVALSVFCATLRRLARRRAALAVVGAPEPVERVLDLCSIDGRQLSQGLEVA